MKRLAGFFLQGLLYLGPIALTGYIIFEIFNFIDNLLYQYLTEVIGMSIPGLGLLIILMIVTLLGYFGQTILANPFKFLFKGVIRRIPPIKLIYSSINDFFAAIVGKERKFNQPVLVRISEDTNLEKLGFITESDLSNFGVKDKVAVYFPFSYTFSGEMFIVPKESVKTLQIPAADVLKFVLSGGVTEIESDHNREAEMIQE